MKSIIEHPKKVSFRTHGSAYVGLGHIARCCRLGKFLRENGFAVTVWLDKVDMHVRKHFPTIEFKELYGSADFIDEADDRVKFDQQIKDDPPNLIVVDDYRISFEWESFFRRKGIQVIVIDDNNERRHDCTLLVDARWTGISTYKRYDSLVPLDCKKLLGPDFLLMDPIYSRKDGGARLVREGSPKRVLLNLGGGADWKKFEIFLSNLAELLEKDAGVIVQPIIGPLAKGENVLLELQKKFHFVQPVIRPKTLFYHLIEADLFITTSGGALFEALCLRVPSLSFEISENQQNDYDSLFDLGHYFALGRLTESEFTDFASLCYLMIRHLSRLKKIYDLPAKITIDGGGVERVGKILLNITPQKKNKEQRPVQSIKTEVQNNSIYRAEKIDDRWINRYRQSRNLSINLEKMTQTKKVGDLEHYLWWFSENKRTSYILYQHEKPVIIFWHQIIRNDRVDCLFGGWFVYDNEVSGSAAYAVLKLQLQITDKEYPGIPWVAVINKQNKFVQTLNKRFGFHEINDDSLFFGIAQAAFPKAGKDDFVFYARC